MDSDGAGLPFFKITMQTCPTGCIAIKQSECASTERLMYEYYAQRWLQLLYEKDTCPSHGTCMWLLILMRAILLCIFAVGGMCILYKIASETVILIKTLVLSLATQLGVCVRELWAALKSFLNTLKDAIEEIWSHLTKENVTTIFALGILVYVLPEVRDAVKCGGPSLH